MNMSRGKVLAVAILGILLLAWGGAVVFAPYHTKSPQPEQECAEVAIQGFSFDPATVTIDAGDCVTWTNKDSVTHTVTSDEGVFDSGNLSKGGTFEFTFVEPGTYNYHCEIHPSMTGTVVVEAKEEVQEFALIHSLSDERIFPSQLTVKKGVKVRLFNTSLGVAHPPASGQPKVLIIDPETGKQPFAEVRGGFAIHPGEVTTVEFTPDISGEFLIDHTGHGHPIQGKLTVVEGA